MATLSIYYSYSKHPTDTHFGVSVLFDWPWTRSPSVNDFCTCKEGNTEYTPNDVDSFLSISVWHVLHDHSLRLSFSFASIRILRQFNSNPNTDSQKSHHNRKTTFYIQGTKRRRGCWLFFFFILFAQICLCVEFCVFRLKIGATALEHLCIAYLRAKKSPYIRRKLLWLHLASSYGTYLWLNRPRLISFWCTAGTTVCVPYQYMQNDKDWARERERERANGILKMK